MNPLVAGVATVFIATSPQFWFAAFQNKPYPLLFALVLFLWTWTTPDRGAPEGLRLVASGLFLGVAILIHQAAVFLAPVVAVALLLYGNEPWPRRVAKILAWGLGTTSFALGIYLWVWFSVTGGDSTFLSWVLEDLQGGGGLHFRFAFSMAQAAMGIAGTVVNDSAARAWFEENLARRPTLEIYAALGLLGCAVVAVAAWVNWPRAVRTLRTNCLAGLCLLMILAWACTVTIYEPATAYHWAPALFPALVLIVLALGASRSGRHRLRGLGDSAERGQPLSEPRC